MSADTLAAALVALQAELPRIAKSETANVVTQKGTYSYTYADLSSISAQILPLLSKHGLSFIAAPTFDGDRFVLRCTLLHQSGQREDAVYPLPSSGTPQAIGSAITYGRRYCLCAMTGLAPEDDDDGAAAEAERGARRSTAQRAAPPPGRTTPASGRPAQRARAASPPPLPSDGPEPYTPQQRAKLMAGFGQVGIEDRGERLDTVARIIGRGIASANQLTKQEAGKVLDVLDQAAKSDNPLLRLAELAPPGDGDPAGDPPPDPAEA